VTSQDIVDAVREARGLQLDRRGVFLEDPIRSVGTCMVVVEVGNASPRRSRRSSALLSNTSASAFGR
jgi:hypothetical protein